MATPRHLLPGADPTASVLAIVAVLVLSSGFVAGTTATYTARTTNAGNAFEAASLPAPTGLTATPSGSQVALQWSPTGTGGAGYRLSVADWQPAAEPVPGTCASPSPFASVGGSASSQFTDATLGAAPHSSFVDGRVWCYRAESVYPYPETARPWVSQVGNPTAVVVVGHTITDIRAGGNGNSILEPGTSSVDGPDYIEVGFNQPIAPADYPSGYLCTDESSGRVLIGVNGSTTSESCPKTSGTGQDTELRGFWATGGSVSETARFRLGSVAPVACPTGARPGCFRLRIGIRQRTAGSNPWLSGSYVVRGTADTEYLTSQSGGRSFCQAGAATTVPGLPSTFKYRADPPGGSCQATATGTL